MKKEDFHGEVWINAHPEIIETVAKINGEPIDGGYGNDKYSALATAYMQQFFSEEIYTTFAINGTAANVMAMKSMLDRWSAIICAEQTHINTYEAGALEFNLGNKILSVKSPDGKLTPKLIEDLLLATKKYKYKPKVVSFAQPTEFGTVYTNEEIKALCDCAHSHGMYAYLDGARIGNAVAYLGTNLTDMIEKTGVDAFSFGGTKAGAMFGEMVVFRRKEFNNYLEYTQKQSLQHMSKSKFLSAQILTVLEKELWLKDGKKSNEAAKKIEKVLREKGVEIYYPVESNMVFCVIPPEKMAELSEHYNMHYWDEFLHTVRIATTFETTDGQIEELASFF